MLDFPSLDSHNVWIATNFQVKAASPEAATDYAQRWLADVMDRATPPRGDGFVVLCSAVSFDDIAALALRLIEMEKQGGDAAAHVHALRAQVTPQQQEEGAAAVAELDAQIKAHNRVIAAASPDTPVSAAGIPGVAGAAINGDAAF